MENLNSIPAIANENAKSENAIPAKSSAKNPAKSSAKNPAKSSAKSSAKDKKDAKLDASNLESYFLNEGEKKKESREGNLKGNYLYLYKENGISLSDINNPIGRGFRKKRRDILERFSNSLFNARLEKNLSKMQDIAKNFNAEYRKFYSLQDYSLASINGGKSLSESYKKDLIALLEIASKCK